MRFNLQRKLLFLLMLVITIALSSSLLLRNFVIRDFRAFGEGRMLDRFYQIQAVLEGRYECSGSWKKEQVSDDIVWAWLSGIELKLYDTEDRLVIDTEQAMASLSPVMKERVNASNSRRPPAVQNQEFQSYPLFLDGQEIGRLDVSLPTPPHEHFFIQSSNRFLAYIVLTLGLVAVILSILAARRISRPLQKLNLAAENLATGDPASRVDINSSDEIGQLSATFNRMAERLQSQEELRKQLVSNAAHELRTPLMIIKGELEGMIDGLLPTNKESLQSLHDEAGRLALILDSVDELTRAQTAQTNLNLQHIPLIPYLKQLLSRFSRQAEEQKVTINTEGDEELKAWIDPDQFVRIIINMVANALRAMQDGGRLDIIVKKSDADSLIIDIKDTGAGMEQEQLPLIFERFYKGKNGGLGLGLAIVKELVEAHSGRISVESETGKGSCFQIELPLKKGEKG